MRVDGGRRPGAGGGKMGGVYKGVVRRVVVVGRPVNISWVDERHPGWQR